MSVWRAWRARRLSQASISRYTPVHAVPCRSVPESPKHEAWQWARSAREISVDVGGYGWRSVVPSSTGSCRRGGQDVMSVCSVVRRCRAATVTLTFFTYTPLIFSIPVASFSSNLTRNLRLSEVALIDSSTPSPTPVPPTLPPFYPTAQTIREREETQCPASRTIERCRS